MVLSLGAPHDCSSQPTHQAEVSTLSSVRFQLARPPVVLPQLFLSDTSLSGSEENNCSRDGLLSCAILKTGSLESSGCWGGSALPPTWGWAPEPLLCLRTRVPAQRFNPTKASEPSPQAPLLMRGFLNCSPFLGWLPCDSLYTCLRKGGFSPSSVRSVALNKLRAPHVGRIEISEVT